MHVDEPWLRALPRNPSSLLTSPQKAIWAWCQKVLKRLLRRKGRGCLVYMCACALTLAALTAPFTTTCPYSCTWRQIVLDACIRTTISTCLVCPEFSSGERVSYAFTLLYSSSNTQQYFGSQNFPLVFGKIFPANFCFSPLQVSKPSSISIGTQCRAGEEEHGWEEGLEGDGK